MASFDSDYFFQHQLIPAAFFNDRGKFISALSEDGGAALFAGLSGVYKQNGFDELPYSPAQFSADVLKCPENDTTDEDIFAAVLTLPEPYESGLCSNIYLIFDTNMNNMMCFCVEKSESAEDGFLISGRLPDGKYVKYISCDPKKVDTLSSSVSFFLDLYE